MVVPGLNRMSLIFFSLNTTKSVLDGLNDGSSYIHAVVDVALGERNVLVRLQYNLVLN